MEGREWIALVVVGTAALLAFVKIGQDVLANQTNAFDGAIRSWISAHRTPVALSFFLWVTRIGSTRAMFALSLVAALYLWYRDRWRVAASFSIAPALAIALYETVKRLYGRARPASIPPMADGSFSFPSAHATAATAVCCSLSYILWREGFLGRAGTILLGAIVPLLVGVSRVYLDAHWATDVLGGWSAGLLIVTLSVGIYHWTRHGPDRHTGVAAPGSNAR